jgi:hypothetical protein
MAVSTSVVLRNLGRLAEARLRQIDKRLRALFSL